ncbi:NYN domain-containing protein [Pyrococcus kukulkanii]|uniref:NYN domain-containing protein n=1 Tax=Pyrococcus kukulkanii TaxID=1609559 RepID=UPI0035647E63
MRTAVLIDGENVWRCLENIIGRKVHIDKAIDWKGLFKFLESLGYEVTIARFYANPFAIRNPNAANNLESMGIKVILARSTMKENGPKSTADIVMIVDGMSIAYERPIDAFVIVSGDGDFLPFAQKVRELGKDVLFATFLEYTARPIKEMFQVVNLLDFSILGEDIYVNAEESSFQRVEGKAPSV